MVDSRNAIDLPAVLLPLTSSPVPSAVAAGTWWIPIIDHPGRPSFVRFARFARKAKPTAAEATAYAAKVIGWRHHFAGFKRRRGEATAHPRYFLEAAE
jgi:hypothetical protein